MKQSRCQFCSSLNTKVYFRDNQFHPVLNELLKTNHQLAIFKDNLINRRNGICKDCGLIQSFNLLTNQTATLLYNDFGDFDVGLEFQEETLSLEVENFLTNDRFGKRIHFYKQYFSKSRPSKVGMIRYWNGALLEAFHSTFGSKVFGFDFIKSCKKSAENKMPLSPIHIEYKSKINTIECSEKLDILISFHNLSHSVDIHNDIKKMTSIVKPGGKIIFMDEIMVKKHNIAHMIHFTETTFLNLLNYYFDDIERVDNIGEIPKHITNFTSKKDNPDYIVTVKE